MGRLGSIMKPLGGHLGASRTYLSASPSWRHLGGVLGLQNPPTALSPGAVAGTQGPLLRIPSGRIRILGKGNIRK